MNDEVSAADVSIQSMTATGRPIKDHVEITTLIDIHNENDDDAQNIRCIVVLPPTSEVVHSTPAAAIGPTYAAVGPPPGFVQSQPTQGYAIFWLASMGVGKNAQFELVTHIHKSWATSPIAAFLYSDVPDPRPDNNFKSVTVQIPLHHRGDHAE